jgi:hypothetical protein
MRNPPSIRFARGAPEHSGAKIAAGPAQRPDESLKDFLAPAMVYGGLLRPPLIRRRGAGTARPRNVMVQREKCLRSILPPV